MSIVCIMSSNHLILCCPLLLLPSILLQYQKERNALVEQNIQKSWVTDSEAKLKIIPGICQWDNLSINKVAMVWNTWNINQGFFVLFFPLHHVASGICFSTRGTCGPAGPVVPAGTCRTCGPCRNLQSLWIPAGSLNPWTTREVLENSSLCWKLINTGKESSIKYWSCFSYTSKELGGGDPFINIFGLINERIRESKYSTFSPPCK